MRLFGLNITQARETSSSSDSSTTTTTTTIPRGANFLGNMIRANSVNTCITLPAVYRAITLRANAMARLVAQYQRRDSNGGNFVMDMGPTRGKHLNYLLQVRPNPYMGWTVLMKQAEVRRLLWGNAYIFIERGMDEEIEHLWLCQNATYNATTDCYYVTYYVGNLVRTLSNVPSRDVLHIRNEFTFDGFNGVGTITYAARTFNLAATQQQLALDTAAKGGARKLVVQEQQQQGYGIGKSTKNQMEKITRDFAESMGMNDVTYLSNVANIKDYSQTLAELQLLESRKFGDKEVANFFSVPVQYLGGDASSNYKTPEFAQLDLLCNGIAPTMAEWEDEMNSKLLDESDFDKHRFHLCESALFRLDRQSQTIWNKSRMETGMVSINELRAEQEMPRIENGDDHYVSTNLAVAGSPKLSGVDAKVTERL